MSISRAHLWDTHNGNGSLLKSKCLCKKVTDLSQFLIASQRSHSTSTPLTLAAAFCRYKKHPQQHHHHLVSRGWVSEWGKKHYVPFFIVGRRSYFKFILKCVRHIPIQMGRKEFSFSFPSTVYILYSTRRRRRQQFLFFDSHTTNFISLSPASACRICRSLCLPKRPSPSFPRDFILFIPPQTLPFASLKLRHFIYLKRL